MTLTKVVGELLKRPVDTACNLIESLLGEPFQIAGGALADQVVFWQWKNRIAIFDKFQRIQKERRLAVRVLAPDFLLPLIRECGDACDETLQEVWARLLAAAVEDDENQHVSFVRVLSELSSNDVKILQAIVDISPGIGDDGKLDRSIRTQRLTEHLGLTDSSISFSINNLRRLGFFNVPGIKFSGFAASFLRVCLIDDDALDRHLQNEKKIEAAPLFG